MEEEQGVEKITIMPHFPMLQDLCQVLLTLSMKDEILIAEFAMAEETRLPKLVFGI